ncbi:MAG: polyamine ABC transporter ATP-binding protein, partial [Candidatus Omnitrophica bacterium]|nr:polyamine ABC transporter ATP-binding protein [Candidatus Omnitrophota bacterium]
ALDEETRQEMYALLKAVQRETGVTTLHITHNREDVERLADRKLSMREGRVEVEMGSPG